MPPTNKPQIKPAARTRRISSDDSSVIEIGEVIRNLNTEVYRVEPVDVITIGTTASIPSRSSSSARDLRIVEDDEEDVIVVDQADRGDVVVQEEQEPEEEYVDDEQEPRDARPILWLDSDMEEEEERREGSLQRSEPDSEDVLLDINVNVGQDIGEDYRIYEEEELLGLSPQPELEDNDPQILIRSSSEEELPPPPAPVQRPKMKKGPLVDPNRKKKKKKKFQFPQTVEVLENDVRPSLFRMKMQPVYNSSGRVKRTRVTKNIVNHPIQQFQDADVDTKIENIDVKPLGETVGDYLRASEPYLPPSTLFFDKYVCTAVEYNNSIKMFHFGKSMKKHSCRQKITKFQTSWWYIFKRPFGKRKSGFFHPSKRPVLKITDDVKLFEHHMYNPKYLRSNLEKVIERLEQLLNRRRVSDDVIRDSCYFVREFFLTKEHISLRYNVAADIPELQVPPTLQCGYFPHSAVNESQRKHYLLQRYQEAVQEYFQLSYTDLEPDQGFAISHMDIEELYAFHKTGRHIHGFFVVWEEKYNPFMAGDGIFVARRYLIDIFHKFRFPLYEKFERWEPRLKAAFDRVTIFNLHLSEIIRCNRPVFDLLAQNPAFFQKLTLEEMCQTMKESDINPRDFISGMTMPELYEWGHKKTNVSHLSAYMIICGGSKRLISIKRYKQRKTFVLPLSDKKIVAVDPEGEVVEVETENPILKVHHLDQNLKYRSLAKKNPRSKYPADFILKTQLVVDIEKPKPKPSKPAPRKNIRTFHPALSRKELILVRRKLYNLDPPPREEKPKEPEFREKKKPGRKKLTPLEKAHLRHDFDTLAEASDIESDYEGYEDKYDALCEREEPELKRTTSALSFHTELHYKNMPLDALSWFHQGRIEPHPSLTRHRKWRKLNRITQRKMVQYKSLLAEDAAKKEIMACYMDQMPNLAKEIKNTKQAVKQPRKFKTLNLPESFKGLEISAVDTVAAVLKRAVLETVVKDALKIRVKNKVAMTLQIAADRRIDAVDSLKPVPEGELPGPVYLLMEALTNTRMLCREDIIDGQEMLHEQVSSIVERFERIPLPEELRKEQAAERREKYAGRAAEIQLEKKEKEEIEKRNKQLQELERQERERIRKEKEKERREKQGRKQNELDIRNDKAAKEKMERERLEQEQRLRKLEKESKERIRREKARIQKEADDRVNALRAEKQRVKDQVDKIFKEKELKKTTEDDRLEKERKEKEARTKYERNEFERMEKLEKLAAVRTAQAQKEQEESEKKKKEEEEKEKERKKQEIEKLQREMKKKQEAERLQKELQLKKEAEKQKLQKEMKERQEAAKLQKELQLKKEAEQQKLQNELKLKQESEKLQKELELKKEAERRQKEMEQKREAEKLQKELEAKQEAEKLRKEMEQKQREAERARKAAMELPDSVDVDLLTVAKEPTSLRFKEARRAFKAADARSLLYEKARHWADAFFEDSHIESSDVFKYLYELIDPTKPKVQRSEEHRKTYENIAKCYKFDVVEPKKRQWTFQYDYDILMGDVTDQLNHTVHEHMESFNRSSNFNQSFEMRTPTAARSDLLRQSLMRTNSRRSGNLSALRTQRSNVFHTPTFAHLPSTEKFKLSNKSQQAFEKETCLEINVSLNNENTEGRSEITVVDQHRESVQLTLEAAETSSDDDDQDDMRQMRKSTQPFWRLVARLGTAETNEEITAAQMKLSELFARNRPNNHQKTSWTFAILGAVSVLITGRCPQSEEVWAGPKTRFVDPSSVEFSKIIENLQLVSLYFTEAEQIPTFLHGIIKINGFRCIEEPILEIIKNISKILMQMSTLIHFKKTATAALIICEIVEEISDHLANYINRFGKLRGSMVANMQKEVAATMKGFFKPSEVRKVHGVSIDGVNCFHVTTMIHWIAMAKKTGGNIAKRSQEVVQLFHENINGTIAKVAKEVQPTIINVEPITEPDRAIVYPRTSTPVTENEPPIDVAEAQIFPETGLATATANIRMPTDKQIKQLRAVALLKRKAQDALENSKPTKLPKYDVTFVDKVWKTIARTMADFSELDVARMKIMDRFRNQHRADSPFRFHLLLSSDQVNTLDMSKIGGRVLKSEAPMRFFVQLRVEPDEDVRLKTESKILRQFENTLLKKQEFNNMKWSVKCGDGTVKHAIEYFTDLKKYEKEKYYKKSLANGVLKFKFKVFKTLWFLGNCLPDRFCPDTHEDNPDNSSYCAGCTNGDVVLVHNCSCEYHDDRHRKNFIYARSNRDVGLYKVTRLAGRFVCKHGPSSVLHLDRDPIPEERYVPKSTKYVEFAGKLRISKRKTMLRELQETFAAPLTELRNHRQCDSCSPISTASSGAETLSIRSNSSSSDDSTEFEDTSDEEIIRAPSPPPVVQEKKEERREVEEEEKEEEQKVMTDLKLLKQCRRFQREFRRYSRLQEYRSARLSDPEKLAARNRIFKPRSRSLDCELEGRSDGCGMLKRHVSEVNLSQLQTHMNKKWKNTSAKLGTEFVSKKNVLITMDEYKLKREILDIANFFNTDSQLKESTKQRIMINMLQCGVNTTKTMTNTEMDRQFRAVLNMMRTSPLLQCRGIRRERIIEETEKPWPQEPFYNNFPKFDDDGILIQGKSVSLAMDEYYKFWQYRNNQMEQAWLMAAAVKALRTRETRRFAKLIRAHELIFQFNYTLFEHLMNLVARHVFNPYAMYYAETTKTIDHLVNGLNNIKVSVMMVMNALFNIEPLKRQLGELIAMEKRVEDSELNLTISELCRYAIERIRVPQTVSSELNEFSWINAQPEFHQTVDILLMSVEDMVPVGFDRTEFFKECTAFHFNQAQVEEICNTFTYDNIAPTKMIFQALSLQHMHLFEVVEQLMPNMMIDPYMKAYYECFSQTRLFKLIHSKVNYLSADDIRKMPTASNALLFSAIIATPIKQPQFVDKASLINEFYGNLPSLRPSQLLIEPSNLGVGFCCFDYTLFVSAVREKKVEVVPEYEFKSQSCVRNGEKSIDVEYSNCTITLMLNQETGILSMVFKTPDTVDKDDRLDFDVLCDEMISPEINWEDIVTTFVSSSFNYLRRTMDNRTYITSKPTATGRMENLFLKECQLTKSEVQRRKRQQQSMRRRRAIQGCFEDHSSATDSEDDEPERPISIRRGGKRLANFLKGAPKLKKRRIY